MRSALLSATILVSLLGAHGRGTQDASARHSLTFEERVAAERAIQMVYHRQRLGEHRPFGEAVPDALLEKRVRDSLAKSAALARFWNVPITDDSLEAEMDRIRAHTRRPEILREMESALGHDALLIRETLARARLSDRLARDRFARDARIHGDIRRQMESLRRDLERRALDPGRDHPWRVVAELVRGDDLGSGGAGASAPSGAIELEAEGFDRERALAPSRVGEIGPVTDEGDAFMIRVVLDQAPDRVRVASYVRPKRSWDDWWARVAPLAEKFRAVPTDETLTQDAAGTALGAEDPAFSPPGFCGDIDKWTVLSTQAAPSPRALHTAIWTGAEMIVWGGRFPAAGNGLATGGVYDPVTDSWSATTLLGVPSGRYLHTAVWTGSEMVIWGGNPGLLQTGARYDPISDSWRPTTTFAAPEGRHSHTAVWTGIEMIVWGGSASPATGGRYDPVADSWRPTSISGAPAGRFWHTSVWSGTEMIVWGGTVSSNAPPMNSGGRYDPSSDTWRDTPLTNAPSPRAFASAVWTGREMIVWGGDFLDTGGIYEPGLDAWRPLSTVGAPAGRAGHTAVWADRLMIVWGGNIPVTGPVNTGGIYDPAIDAWTPVSMDNAPPARLWHTAVMASSEMIVWGGYDGTTLLGSGASYGVDVFPDADGDGLTICHGDCDDTDPQVGGGPELPGNAKDEDCDGVLLCDPGASWDNLGEFRRCVVNACADLERRGLVRPPQCRRPIVRIPVQE